MNENWNKFITKQGAIIKNDQVIAFGKTSSHFYSHENTYVCDLSTLGIIRASGEEAQNFLHGQFTNDLNKVSSSISQISSYCNPKGRMLSIFRIYKRDDDYFLILPRDVLEPTFKKLTMFKLMSKVDLSDDSDQFVIFGVAGPDTKSTLTSLNITIPKQVNHCVQDTEVIIIRLPSENTRVLFITNAKYAISFWKQLTEKLSIATSHLWDLHDIYSGIPQITANTCEAFIPQMTNFELIDGVNFSKGCYPGQEVVARTHYLGKPNRRMYRVSVADDNVPEPGTNIFSPEDENQPVGKIVTAQKTSNDNYSALIVLRTEKEDDDNLHLGSITGPKILMQSLPYSLGSESK